MALINSGDFFQEVLVSLIFVVMYGYLIRWRDNKKEIKTTKAEIGRRLLQKLTEYKVCNEKKADNSKEIIFDSYEISLYLQGLIFEIAVISEKNKREYKDVMKQVDIITKNNHLGSIIEDCQNDNVDIEVVRKKQGVVLNELLILANLLFS